MNSATGMISVDAQTPLAPCPSLTNSSNSCSCSCSRVPPPHTELPHCPPSMEVSNSNSHHSSKNWLSKVCSKLRSGGKGRMEKCEKCGQRSDTCLPNASFVSGRKHYLCGDCRLTSRNMKTMYHQLCRNLSLREHSSRTTITTTTTTTTNDLSSSASSSASSSPAQSPASLTRSKSLKVRPTSPAESGYDTATSLDSSSSSDRVMADAALSTSSGECGRCCSPSLHLAAAGDGAGDQSQTSPAKDEGSQCRRPAVFGGAFKSERVHLHRLQQFMVEEWVKSQSPVAGGAAERPPRHHEDTASKPAAKDTPATKTAGTKQYDGYLEIRTPNSQSVKYVFKRPEVDAQSTVEQQQQQEQQEQDGGVKQCYRCRRTLAVAFRAPFGHGWLCEDCMDDLM